MKLTSNSHRDLLTVYLLLMTTLVQAELPQGQSSFNSFTSFLAPDNCKSTGTVQNIAGIGSPGQSFLRFINTSHETINHIAGTVYQADGRVVGAPDQLLINSLAPGQSLLIHGGQLGDLVGGAWVGTASLSITGAPAELIVINITRGSQNSVTHSCEKEETQQALKSCGDPRPEACIAEFAPVCAKRDNGVRCITEPCPSIEWQTYPNGCSACSDPLVFGHLKGSCEFLLEGTPDEG